LTLAKKCAKILETLKQFNGDVNGKLSKLWGQYPCRYNFLCKVWLNGGSSPIECRPSGLLPKTGTT